MNHNIPLEEGLTVLQFPDVTGNTSSVFTLEKLNAIQQGV